MQTYHYAIINLKDAMMIIERIRYRNDAYIAKKSHVEGIKQLPTSMITTRETNLICF